MAGKIGPHESKELKLLLSGKKKCAMFFFSNKTKQKEHIPQELYELASVGRIVMLEFYNENMNVIYHFFTAPGEEWRAKMIFCMNMIWSEESLPVKFSIDDIHRMEGTLLGYSRADVDLFIDKWNSDNIVP